MAAAAVKQFLAAGDEQSFGAAKPQPAAADA
jgi:hypothetical protein